MRERTQTNPLSENIGARVKDYRVWRKLLRLDLFLFVMFLQDKRDVIDAEFVEKRQEYAKFGYAPRSITCRRIKTSAPARSGINGR